MTQDIIVLQDQLLRHLQTLQKLDSISVKQETTVLKEVHTKFHVTKEKLVRSIKWETLTWSLVQQDIIAHLEVPVPLKQRVPLVITVLQE